MLGLSLCKENYWSVPKFFWIILSPTQMVQKKSFFCKLSVVFTSRCFATLRKVKDGCEWPTSTQTPPSHAQALGNTCHNRVLSAPCQSANMEGASLPTFHRRMVSATLLFWDMQSVPRWAPMNRPSCFWEMLPYLIVIFNNRECSTWKSP